MTQTKRIPVNAYRASEAQTALRTELRKRGVPFTSVEASNADMLTGPALPFEKVALQVTRSSDGRSVPVSALRTYMVTVTND